MDNHYLRFTVWGQVDPTTLLEDYLGDDGNAIFLTVDHAETWDEDEEASWRLTTSQLAKAHFAYGSKVKMRHIGGTFVERLAAGDDVAITQSSYSDGFVYSDDGGGVLTFRGELIAPSNFGP